MLKLDNCWIVGSYYFDYKIKQVGIFEIDYFKANAVYNYKIKKKLFLFGRFDKDENWNYYAWMSKSDALFLNFKLKFVLCLPKK